MTPEQAALFREYEELKASIREAEKRLKAIAPTILALMPEDAEVQGAHGHFYIQKRASWKYSPTTELAEKALKETKSREQANGIAIVSYDKVLYYKGGEQE